MCTKGILHTHTHTHTDMHMSHEQRYLRVSYRLLTLPWPRLHWDSGLQLMYEQTAINN